MYLSRQHQGYSYWSSEAGEIGTGVELCKVLPLFHILFLPSASQTLWSGSLDVWKMSPEDWHNQSTYGSPQFRELCKPLSSLSPRLEPRIPISRNGYVVNRYTQDRELLWRPVRSRSSLYRRFQYAGALGAWASCSAQGSLLDSLRVTPRLCTRRTAGTRGSSSRLKP